MLVQILLSFIFHLLISNCLLSLVWTFSSENSCRVQQTRTGQVNNELRVTTLLEKQHKQS